tara:strand:- start:1016 stop:1393 length:378 start_codon:yes stop_codon:yes gene_type:complete
VSTDPHLPASVDGCQIEDTFHHELSRLDGLSQMVSKNVLSVSPFDDLCGLCLEVFPFFGLEGYDSLEHLLLDLLSPFLLHNFVSFPHEPLNFHQFILFFQNSVIGFRDHERSFDYPTVLIVFGAL